MADYYKLAQDFIVKLETEGRSDSMQDFADGLKSVVEDLTERWNLAESEAKEQG